VLLGCDVVGQLESVYGIRVRRWWRNVLSSEENRQIQVSGE